MKEEWRDIEGFEGLYQVSNYGRVKSVERTVRCDRGYRIVQERILKAGTTDKGYLQVQLCKDGKVKNCYVHRLVADAFCDNPMGYTELNHRDENKENNRIENLEWCSRSYNTNYGTGNKRRAEKLSKPVFSVDKESGLIMWWKSAKEAEECTGIDSSNIIKCCKGKYKSAGNHIWFYADED